MAHRAEDFWTPDRKWEGKTVFLLGGGDSLRTFDLDRLRGRIVVAINELVKRAPWADALFFLDNGWFDKNRTFIEGFQGEIITHSRVAKRAMGPRVKRVSLSERPDFPPPGSPVIRSGRSSGHVAASLAVARGAARCVLLGYDMRIVNGRSHSHDAYSRLVPELYSQDFILNFAGWNMAARKAGTAIVNATPGSALTEFPMVDIEDELANH